MTDSPKKFPYKFIKYLGAGAFGQVQLVQEETSGQQWAIKEISKASINQHQDAEKNLINEIQIMQDIKSPNVVQIKEVLSGTNKYYLVLEYCANGDLMKYHKAKGTLRQEEVITIIQQIFTGIQALHQYKVVHKDIKQENIFYNNGVFKLGDFGFARYYDDKDEIKASATQGTPAFMAPELITSGEYYTSKVDMWAIGVVTFYLLFNCYPFFMKNEGTNPNFLFNVGSFPDCDFTNAISQLNTFIVNKIKQGFIHKYWQAYFRGIFEIDARKRISWQELYQLPLFVKFTGYMEDEEKSSYFAKSSINFRNQMQSQLKFYNNLKETEDTKTITISYQDAINTWNKQEELVNEMITLQQIHSPSFSNGATLSLMIYTYLRRKQVYDYLVAKENFLNIPDNEFKVFIKSKQYTKIQEEAQKKFEEAKILKQQIGNITKKALNEQSWNAVNNANNADEFYSSGFKIQMINYAQKLKKNCGSIAAANIKALLLKIAFMSKKSTEISFNSEKYILDREILTFNNLPEEIQLKNL